MDGGMQAPTDATPNWAGGETPAVGATPTPKRQRSRWDETPMGATPAPGATPAVGAGLPLGMTPGATPMGGLDMATPSPSMLPTGATPTAEQYQVCAHPIWANASRCVCPLCSPEIGWDDASVRGRHCCSPIHWQLGPCQVACGWAMQSGLPPWLIARCGRCWCGLSRLCQGVTTLG